MSRRSGRSFLFGRALHHLLIAGVSAFLPTQIAVAAVVHLDARGVQGRGLTLDPGTYLVRPIGLAEGGLYDAWSPWATTSCGNSSGCSWTCPTSKSGWINEYRVTGNRMTSVTIDGLPAFETDHHLCASEGSYFLASASESTVVIRTPLVYADAVDAHEAALVCVFSLTERSTVGFSIPDPSKNDNRGGMSLQVDPTESTGFPNDIGYAGPIALTVSPNPLLHRSRITFSTITDGALSLSLFDSQGRVVKIVELSLPSGEHSFIWDGCDAIGAPVAGGVYFLRLDTDQGSVDSKITVVH